MEITKMTRVFAQSEDGESFIITNNQVVSFDDLRKEDLGCLVNTETKTISPELPILSLTKYEYFGKVTKELNLEEVKSYEKLC